jgi:hypothetical protein
MLTPSAAAMSFWGRPSCLRVSASWCPRFSVSSLRVPAWISCAETLAERDVVAVPACPVARLVTAQQQRRPGGVEGEDDPDLRLPFRSGPQLSRELPGLRSGDRPRIELIWPVADALEVFGCRPRIQLLIDVGEPPEQRARQS